MADSSHKFKFKLTGRVCSFFVDFEMSGSNHRKKRKKSTSYSSNTKSASYICSGCNFAFPTKDQLLSHKESSAVPECISDLHSCQCCGKNFLTANGLSMHEYKSSSCGRAKLLPDIVNTIPFCTKISNNSQSERRAVLDSEGDDIALMSDSSMNMNEEDVDVNVDHCVSIQDVQIHIE